MFGRKQAQKAIRARIGPRVHLEEGCFYFRFREVFMQNMQARDGVWVDLMEVKSPRRVCRGTNEGHEKIREDLGLLVMRGEVVSIVSESKDLVLPKALIVFSPPLIARETLARQCQYIIFSWIVHLRREMMIMRVRSSVGERGLHSSV